MAFVYHTYWIFFRIEERTSMKRRKWTWWHVEVAFVAAGAVYGMGIVLAFLSMGAQAIFCIAVYSALAVILGIAIGWSAGTMSGGRAR